jgi:hypothetical protein
MDDAIFLELFEPVREHVGRDAGQAAAEIGEPSRANQEVADDEQCPAFADHFDGASQTAVLAVGSSCHAEQSYTMVDVQNSTC